MTVKGTPKTFSPSGLSDAIDGNNVFPGACSALINLIPLPSTRNLWTPRPAHNVLTRFDTFNNPGVISALKVIGDIAYGMIASDRNTGKDEPFAYDIAAGTFISISGVTNANTPSSPPASGNWTPPIMELVGTNLIVTHPGFTGIGSNFFGVIDLTNPAAPVWSSQNTTTTPIPFVPVAVANYKGRAVFAVRAFAYFTNPLTLVVQASRTLYFDDDVNINALKILSLGTQFGGIVAALIVIKGSRRAYQVKGDFDTPSDPVTNNSMNYATGTEAPLSMVDTPEGIALIAPDGMRLIDFNAVFSPPIGTAGDGVNVPFLDALVPSRIASACNASVLRVSVQNGAISGQPFQEYWYHLGRTPQMWSGPHTFAPRLIQAYGTAFITAPEELDNALCLSTTVPNTTTTYTDGDNTDPNQWLIATTMLPDEGDLAFVYDFNEMTVDIALDPAMIEWVVSAINPQLVVYDTVQNVVPNTAPVWDAAVWDSDLWDGVASNLTPRRVNWSKPIPTSRCRIVIQGGSAGGVILGALRFRKAVYLYVPETGQ